MSDADQIRAWLQAEVEANWAERKSALLLSQAGFNLRRKFPNFAEEMPGGLKDYLLRWPIAHVVQHPTIPQKIGLVPTNINLPSDVSELFANSIQREGHTPFVNSFWRAFIEKIEGKRFVYVTEDGIQVQDFVPPAVPRPDGKEILQSDLGPIDETLSPEDKGRVTQRKIREWLDRNSVPISAVRRKENPGVRADSNFAEKLGRAVLEMEQHDLAKISVPLDILLKILKKVQ